MIRRVLSGAGALAVVLGGALVAQGPPSGATPTPVTLSGAVTCTATGVVKFSPALVNGGSSSETLTVKTKLVGCSGPGASGGGVTLTKSALVATASVPANNCGQVLSGSELPDLNGTVKWKGSGGKVTPSTIDIRHATILFDPNGDDGSGSIEVSLPTNVTAGSYAGESGTFSGLTANKSGGPLTARCGAKGLKAITIGKPGGTVTGSVTIGSES